MLPLTSHRTRPGSILLAALSVAACAALVAWTASAKANGCANTFTNHSGGSWFTATNWSTEKVPSSGEEVCLTESGTYTVELRQTGANVTLKSLKIGGSSGTATLEVESTSSANAELSTSEGLAITTHGALAMTNAPDKDENTVTLAGPIENAGTLTVEKGNGPSGGRALLGNVTNTGTIAIEKNTEFNSEHATLKNEDELSLAEGVDLHVSGKASFDNASGGKLTAASGADVLASGSEASFTEGAGTTSGTLPVIVDDSSLSYTGTGASTIAARGTSTLSGSLASGQTLEIQSTSGENAQLTAAASFTNAGQITLSNASDGDQNSATLVVDKGETLTNSGTIASEPGNGSGGSRTLAGSITNTGTIEINKNTEFNSSSATTLTNEGALTIASGVALSSPGKGRIVNAAGSITAVGSGDVSVHGGEASFVEGAGTTSGSLPVIVDDSSLSYTGTGASTIAARGTGALAGNLASGQTLLVQSTAAENVQLTAAASFTNAGHIDLTNASDGDQNGSALVVGNGETLTNSGTIACELGNGTGGYRTLEGAITNSGTLTISRNTEYAPNAAANLTNEGTLEIANGATLSSPGKGKVVNSSGTIAAAGNGGLSLHGSGTSFTEGAGTTSGTLPVIVDDSSLSYTGTGASTIAVRGTSTLSGSLASGQNLQIQSTSGENAQLTAAASFTNAGQITLSNASDGDQNSATLVIDKGETLTNSGTIASEPGNGSGGSRTLEGDVTNTGSLEINRNTEFTGSSATLDNEGKLGIAEASTLTVTGSSTVQNSKGTIEAAGSGSLSQRGGTFEQGAGTTAGTQPVTVDDATLRYVGDGASTVALRGTSALGGSLHPGQTLLLQSTSSENDNISASSFTNEGKIVMTNASDGDGNNVTLSLAGGTITNTKKGKIAVEHGHGGTRTIEGSIDNEKTLFVAAGATLHLGGTLTETKKATLEVEIQSASSFGVLAASGPANLEGTLSLKQAKGFKGAEGEKFAFLTASSRSGAFTKVKKAAIKKTSLMFEPDYLAAGVTLVIVPA
ncbi:MAG TPA: hypothetical protein VMA83_04830 [Solirubrobacteraceae bacterium]|nr:hypothetical protein [Solirubrobacteraceae bacterium]